MVMRDGTAGRQIASDHRHVLRDGTAGGSEFIVNSLQFIIYCLELIVDS